MIISTRTILPLETSQGPLEDSSDYRHSRIRFLREHMGIATKLATQKERDNYRARQIV